MSKQSRKFKVPDELANLYDFANSLDVRHFTHHGVAHMQCDELASPREFEAWMSQRGLLSPGAKITPAMFETALQLRTGVRFYLECDPGRASQEQRCREVPEQGDPAVSVAGSGGRGRRRGAAGRAHRRAGRIIQYCCRVLRGFHKWNSGSFEDVRGRRVPPGVLRPVEAGDAAMVHVDAVREPQQDAQLSRAPSRRRVNLRSGIVCRCGGNKSELDSYAPSINRNLTI